MKLLTIIMCALLALPSFGQYVFLHSNFTYSVSDNPLAYADRVARLPISDFNPSIITNTITIEKPSWLLQAEGLFLQGMQLNGYTLEDLNTLTYQEFGMQMLLRIAQTNDPDLSTFSDKWKTILESLYNSITEWAEPHGYNQGIWGYPFLYPTIAKTHVYTNAIIWKDTLYSPK